MTTPSATSRVLFWAELTIRFRPTAVMMLATTASPTPQPIARIAPGWAVLAAKATSMARRRMTSTPSRRMMNSDPANAGPKVPAGCPSTRPRASATRSCKSFSFAPSASPFRPDPTSPRIRLNSISNGRTSRGFSEFRIRSKGSKSTR